MLYCAYMYRGRGISTAKSGGFTVVETLIFLAVSMAMFVSATVLISGRQGKIQFNNAVRDFESNLIDMANDVANGYYQSNNDITCTVLGGAPNPQPATKDLGTNQDCIFIGRVVMPDKINPESFNTYSLAGLRTVAGAAAVGAEKRTNDVATLAQAMPRLIHNVPSAIDNKDIGYGTTIQCIEVDTGGGLPTCASASKTALAFLTNIRGGIAETESSNKSGAGIHAVLYAYSPADYQTSDLKDAVAIASYGTTAKSAVICLKSGTTNQYAQIKIGADSSSSLTITSEIRNTPCP